MTSVRRVIVGPVWTRTFKCVWMLEELGCPYETLEKARPVSRLARKYNPTGKVPILLENDKVLTESVAINTYLGDCFPESKLVPRVGTWERALYDSYVCGILSELDAQGLWIHRKHADMKEFFGEIPTAVTHAKEQFHRVNAVYRQVLQDSNGSYLLGTDFTAADILYCYCIDWAYSIQWIDKNDNDALLQDYRERCHARPAYQRAHDMRKASWRAMKNAETNNPSRSTTSSKL